MPYAVSTARICKQRHPLFLTVPFWLLFPLLAVLVGIAKGFGFQATVRKELLYYFPGHENELNKAFQYVENYLAQAQGGVIIGIGLVLLFYTVINLISSIEDTFNDIWQIKSHVHGTGKYQTIWRCSLILPILMTASSGLSIFASTLQNSFPEQLPFFTPLVELALNVVPYIITIMAFTGLYVSLPNTKSQVHQRPDGRYNCRLRLSVLPIYLYQRTDLG